MKLRVQVSVTGEKFVIALYGCQRLAMMDEYMCNELGEVNAGWIPAQPASVDQDHTRNNRHNPLMV